MALGKWWKRGRDSGHSATGEQAIEPPLAAQPNVEVNPEPVADTNPPPDGEPSGALSADQPIEAPDQDLFGFDPFAHAIAKSISGLTSPEGVVIGLHGPWGAGKSSAVNLIKHHLASGDLAASADLTLVEFNPWWFNGQDALALAFFGELGAAAALRFWETCFERIAQCPRSTPSFRQR
jgi:hypothetical protein